LLARFSIGSTVVGRATEGYVRLSGGLIRKSAVAIVALVVLSVCGWLFWQPIAFEFLAR